MDQPKPKPTLPKPKPKPEPEPEPKPKPKYMQEESRRKSRPCKWWCIHLERRGGGIELYTQTPIHPAVFQSHRQGRRAAVPRRPSP